MAFEIHEQPESPEVDERNDGTTVTVKYVFHGTNNYAELRMYVLEQTPVTIPYAGKVLGRRNWRPRIQPGEWGYVDVIYDSGTSAEQAIQPEGPPGEPPTPPPFTAPSDTDTLDSNWTLTTRGGTVHILQSKELVASVKAGGGTPPDTGTLIGPSAKGVRGCDIHGMKLSASITIPTSLKLPLLRTLARIDEPKTNDSPWLGMAAGEWLYVGCDAQGSATGTGTLTIHLEGGENLEAGDSRLIINSSITLPEKKAHDYVDFVYAAVTDNGADIQEAYAAYVHRVYDEMSFSEAFGFG